MNKLLQSLGLMVALATVSGCELYFGGHGSGGGGGGTWNYCGSDGYYQCQGDNCTWVGSTCPSTSGGGSNTCTTSANCAAGCYCASGVCEEGGFCTTNADCGTGYHCNPDRSSCEPNPPKPPGCETTGCGAGTFCDTATHACTTGSCAGTVTCNTAKPMCPIGQAPLIFNGCYTGTCFETAMCAPQPTCANINDETNCLANGSKCAAVYVGIGCKKPDGTACHAGDVNCTCQSFQFNSCADKTSPLKMVIENNGVLIDASPLLLQ